MTVVPNTQWTKDNGRSTGKGTLGMAAVHFVGQRLSKSLVGLLRTEGCTCAAPIDRRLDIYI
jgi:hypothetical protein